MEENIFYDYSKRDLVLVPTYKLLTEDEYISSDDTYSIRTDFAYIFLNEKKDIEAMFKVICREKKIYVLYKDNKPEVLNISEDGYDELKKFTIATHECLRRDPYVDKYRQEKGKTNDEVNMIDDDKFVAEIKNAAIKLLLNGTRILEYEVPNIHIDVGYAFIDEYGMRCALCKVINPGRDICYIEVIQDKPKIIGLDEELYNLVIRCTKMRHECIR